MTDRNPAPEKVAALALFREYRAAVGRTIYALGGHKGYAEDLGPLGDRVEAALNAAGYDVARIEEGERLRKALERLEGVGSAISKITPNGQAVDPHPRTWHVFDDALEQARAALAASDEAAK